MNDPVFGHAQLRAHFEDDAFIDAMVSVEKGLARAQAALGIVPETALVEIEALKRPDDASRLLRDGVATAGVPVPALVANLRRQLSAEAADWLHFGATSQDIVDTAFCLRARSALDDLGTLLAGLIDTLEALSRAHATTLMLARTRGQLATPITFGLRVAQWAQPLIRLEAELAPMRVDVLRVQLGGASGSRSVFGTEADAVTRQLAEGLGLGAGAPWHTDRSGFRRLAGWLGRLVAATAKIGRDIGISARVEIAELRLTDGGGSSTMPHKSNPVAAEALQALLPVAQGCEAGLAAAAVHAEERDGAYWPVEWAFLPMLFEIAGAGLAHAEAVFATLDVDAAAMRSRLEAEPRVRAEAAVFALAQTVGRVEATRIVTTALASGRSLGDALADQDGLDRDAVFSDEAFSQPAARTAAQIFSGRASGEGSA